MAEKMRREIMQGEEEEYEELMQNEDGKSERTYTYNKIERVEFRQKHGIIFYYIHFPETWTWHTAAKIMNTILNFKNIVPGSRPVRGIGVDSKPLQIHGCGDIAIKSLIGGRWYNNVIQDVLFVPGLGANLFSVRSVTKRGFNVSFIGDQVKITHGKKIVTTGTSVSDNLYALNVKHASVEDFSPTVAMAALTNNKPNPIDVWHKRLGHSNFSSIKKMAAEHLVEGLNIAKEKEHQPSCEECVCEKAHRLPSPTERRRGKRVGKLIHSDLCGPMSCTSPGGAKYFVSFKDDYRGYVTVNFLKNKSDAQQCLKYFVERLEVGTGNRVDSVRSDNGDEFFTADVSSWLKEKGIRQESGAPITSQQERLSRTITESAKKMLHYAEAPNYLRAEAVHCAVYLQNRSVSETTNFTSFETMKGFKPTLNHLRIFGSEVFVHVPKGRKGKFDPEAIKCLHMRHKRHSVAGTRSLEKS